MTEPQVRAVATAPGTVRSFKRRRGRMSAAKHHALRDLGPRWRIDLPAGNGPIDRPAVFGRTGAPLALDIGFGSGESTVALASAHPDLDVLAVEVHTTGIAHLLRGAERAGLTNVRIVEADVCDVLPHIPAGTLARVQLFFPDPWPKRRHRGRRLVQTDFVHALVDRMRAGGLLHVATDCDSYAAQTLAVLAAEDRLGVDDVRQHRAGTGDRRPRSRPLTVYERRGLEAGRTVTDLLASLR